MGDLPVVQVYSLTVVPLARHTIALLEHNKQRLMALFLVAVILFGASMPSAVVVAATLSANSTNNQQGNSSNTPSTLSPVTPTSLTRIKNTPPPRYKLGQAVRPTKGTAISGTGSSQPIHKTSTTPSIGKINMNRVPAPDTGFISNLPAAADATEPVANSAAKFLSSVTSKVSDSPLEPSVTTPSLQPHELTADRTATSSDYLNSNGTVTKTVYTSPHFYKNGGSWDTIDTSLVTDTNAGDSGNVLGRLWGKLEALVINPQAYMVKANSWQARFTPSNYAGGMVRIKQGNSQVGFSPIGANDVDPVISKTPDGTQIVQYNNLWNGINVEYLVESDQVKEAIMLTSKDVASQVQFKLIGGNLQKPNSNGGTATPVFNITNALNDQLSINPSTLFLNTAGPVSNQASGLTETSDGDTVTLGISGTYLQNLPSKDFPAVIDPNVSFGTRTSGDYESFETNGYNCPSTVCDPYAGSLYDSSNNRQYWRSAIHVDYSVFQNNSSLLQSASLHLYQRTGTNWWTGYTGTFAYDIGQASCLNGYNCMANNMDSANIGASGDITATNIFQNWISQNNWGGWIMIDGNDGSALNWKAFDPDNSYITFTYNAPISAPTFQTPTQNQVFVTTQPSLNLNVETNPNNSIPLQYAMEITDANGSGTLVTSGSFQASTQWTVPSGVLEDGSTYYVSGESYDPSTGLKSPWSTPVAFRIDTRQGQDKTQSYDTVGPVNADLATGNIETSISSHTSTALGGSLSVGLDYNSPLRSTSGLVGSYWNNGQGSASSPQLQRVDQNVDFNWAGSSPGAPINSTGIEAEWNGYFVVPATGSYSFGAASDTSTYIYLNGSEYNESACGPSPCYGSSSNLNAGDVVPIKVDYTHTGTDQGPDNVHLWVEGSAISTQIIPSSWFQTGAQPVNQTQGLIGHYYTYTDTGVPPTIPSDNTGLFLTRTDPLINFNWGSNSPIPGGPTTDFMTRWIGYVTVPVTGSYVFGTQSDDGSDITITINGTANEVYNKWKDSPGTTGYGTAVTLTAGQSYPITVDYYQHLGASTMSLLVEPLGGPSQVVPSSWLSPQGQVLPTGWNLGLNPDGSVTYTRMALNGNNADLIGSSGETYDYIWSGSGYTPPTNSYGSLVRNSDGTFTLIDSDGKTYTFDQSGTLTSVTSPTDDTNPAALKYTYGSVYTGGPVTIQKISDGVNANRYAAIYYSEASQCGSIPSGFAPTPANMLCAVQTNDGRTTYFYYDTNGNLAEVLKPGNDATTYQYQAVQNSAAQTIGYQLSGVRSDLANDAVVAGVRANDQTTFTTISYDILGRVEHIVNPKANSGDTLQMGTYFNYLPGTLGYQNGNPATGYYGATLVREDNVSEPLGYTKRIEYDNLFRTTTSYNVEGLTTTQQWFATKDLLFATTNPAGLESTTIYDYDDRPITTYGPAPSSWFTTTTDPTTGYPDITPQSTHASAVARNDVSYDGGMSGLAVAYMPVSEPTSSLASLTQTPLLHSTNIASDGTISHTWGSTAPIPGNGNWGFSMTGTMGLSATGAYTFTLASDEGMRMWIDNQLVIDDWKDNPYWTGNTNYQATKNDTYTYNNTTINTSHTVRIDYYHITRVRTQPSRYR